MQAARHARLMSRTTSRTLVRSHVHVQKLFLTTSTSRAQLGSVASTAAAASQTPPPSPPPSQGRWRHFLQTLGRVTLVTVVGASATFYYIAHKEKHPGSQLPFDPSKKTLVILGSGWGATSLLKGLDTSDYNTIVVSPKNFFLFTPLLPSVAVGTLNARSIVQPTRYLTRHKSRQVLVIEAEAKEVDPVNKTVTLSDDSEIQGQISSTTIPYDYLVYAVGAETQTFGIPGVKEHACFMKELHDAEKMQRRFLDCVESAAFPGQSDDEKDRLLHMVVVGGGPTGIELSGELRDFLEEDLKSWYPELASRIRITLVEALPNVLPSFSKELIAYTERTFKESEIEILTKTMVRKVNEKSVVLKGPDGVEREVPCGMVVWAAGNTGRQITRDLMAKLPEDQTNKRGINIDDYLRMKGSRDIFAIGDCTASSYAPTAQVASQQGSYLARVFKLLAKKDRLEGDLTHAETSETAEKLKKQVDKVKLKPFHYSHQGSLAYIGSDKAIADLPIFGREWTSGGVATFMFWRSAYLSTLFSLRNRSLVAGDWVRVKLWGRDVSRE
ncbi:NDE2, mitochondrial external NADH dehydrogenase [Suillus paluster]|uniref:NDE2, mitochondrial external NADH dehydrogenase n=1 Tax=Suillus paluster TaxID=48578 RepID=UPI001B870E8F|nr:NDE2, mitochondrial external NADH dehydrogenase [Suillus paluster]KAG1733906.1 NDE2, mitochondrial external NADH dehydrogenase [Suillus paluster]